MVVQSTPTEAEGRRFEPVNSHGMPPQLVAFVFNENPEKDGSSEHPA
jgi:hypothetical protein